ncbi:hypothetical protein OIU77_002239 [Salix suchowensis]|uniref:Vesicle transport protein GOT1B n=1 Tax=Salix suchowensis TaxID=1278906 RepID=A0ABQ9B6D0_9ROSI|nr:hypothetical protein OIU77_002239 [Salix suchowensis]
MVSFEMTDRKKIGLGLTGFGIFFSFLGIVFFFDKGFLAMGNILFISGVSLTIGPKSTMEFFMKRQNFKGTISFGAGFFFVVIGWPVIGMILEAYGFIVLFSGFWPTLAVFIQKIPFIGWVFQQPYVRSNDYLLKQLLSTCHPFCFSDTPFASIVNSFLIDIVAKECLCKYGVSEGSATELQNPDRPTSKHL